MDDEVTGANALPGGRSASPLAKSKGAAQCAGLVCVVGDPLDGGFVQVVEGVPGLIVERAIGAGDPGAVLGLCLLGTARECGGLGKEAGGRGQRDEGWNLGLWFPGGENGEFSVHVPNDLFMSCVGQPGGGL